MASIERTAYPRFKRNLTKKELHQIYTPTIEETQFVHSFARGSEFLLKAMVLLKTFQKLGYFPKSDAIPKGIIEHIRDCLSLSLDTPLDIQPSRVTRKYQQKIREYFHVIPNGKETRPIMIKILTEAAKVKDHPPDLINIAIEELVKNRCELPSFRVLDELTGQIRRAVNEDLFQLVFNRLSSEQIHSFNELLIRSTNQHYSDYNRFKTLPKKPTLKNLRDHIDYFIWLQSYGDMTLSLEGISPSKIKYFAAEAKSLDAAELKDYSEPKRITLLISLIHQSQVKTKDHLAEMYQKRIGTIHNSSKEDYKDMREQKQNELENLISIFNDVLLVMASENDDAVSHEKVKETIASYGSVQTLLDKCEAVASIRGNNYYPFIQKHYKNSRSILFKLADLLQFTSTSQDQSLMYALEFVMENRNKRTDRLPDEVDLSFASDQWRRMVRVKQRVGGWLIHRRHLEACVLSCIATELKSGDICVPGSESYADYRKQLLPWEECKPLISEYCRELGFPDNEVDFVKGLKSWMIESSKQIDRDFPDNEHVSINEVGEPILKKVKKREYKKSLKELEALIKERLPERNLIDILCNVEHWINWTRHFGPSSGSDPKLKNPRERYILTTFAYGCNLGPIQAARHMRADVTGSALSYTNQRHITARKIDQALKDIINHYHYEFDLPKLWGKGESAAADGTKYDIYEENLLAEYHIRYGGYGGIAYHHVSDNYIALFSHFIPCGVWEAVYILDGLLKNESDMQPDTIHADTQGQSTPVFGLSHLLGIKLMPRIRNFKQLTFFRPSTDIKYKHIDSLFSDTIDWDLIELHWKDLLRVVLSIKHGKISSAMLLRRLGNYSQKNKLYQAFRELGRVVRTVFLLQYISDIELRRTITATTNKAEAYNGFSKWLFFGGHGIIAENDPEQQEKFIKYGDLVANAVIFQNVVDMTTVIRQLRKEGHFVDPDDLSALSPYLMEHIKRFGDYVIDLEEPPQPLDGKLGLVLKTA
ncbi:Tn3 family transposase [Bacillus sp. BRMEA1]|uniref:Tn3 family transposase n=1 Tax=Neobacillus endophyticus TaxID=2738405 RepID=UPI0015656730|nr:Tn3 family transposase [Neobacillus endophyticus]NRD81010.1 Tn3 family transposase [Neobacillus endophyticus]